MKTEAESRKAYCDISVVECLIGSVDRGAGSPSSAERRRSAVVATAPPARPGDCLGEPQRIDQLQSTVKPTTCATVSLVCCLRVGLVGRFNCLHIEAIQHWPHLAEQQTNTDLCRACRLLHTYLGRRGQETRKTQGRYERNMNEWCLPSAWHLHRQLSPGSRNRHAIGCPLLSGVFPSFWAVRCRCWSTVQLLHLARARAVSSLGKSVLTASPK